MSKEIKILKVLGAEIDNYDYNTSIEYSIVQGITDWETVSEEEYLLINKYFNTIIRYPRKHVLVVKKDTEDEKLSVSYILEKCKEKDETEKKRLEKNAKELAKKNKEKIAKSKERDLKKAKELLKKHGLDKYDLDEPIVSNKGD